MDTVGVSSDHSEEHQEVLLIPKGFQILTSKEILHPPCSSANWAAKIETQIFTG
jgi:hypothetical protein